MKDRLPMLPRPRILVVGEADTRRAPMFAFMLQRARDNARLSGRVESAGVPPHVAPGEEAEPHAVTCMDRVQLDIRRHRSRSVAVIDLRVFDQIICLSSTIREWVEKELETMLSRQSISLVIIDDSKISSPSSHKLTDYETCAREINTVVTDMVAQAIRARRRRSKESLSGTGEHVTKSGPQRKRQTESAMA